MALESTLGNYYIQIQHPVVTALVLVTDRREWKLIDVAPSGAWPNRPSARRGTWEEGQFGWSICFAEKTGSDASSPDQNTRLEVFRLTDLDFPPDISAREGFFSHQFRMGGDLAALDRLPTGVQRAPSGRLTVPTHGNWTPYVSGPVLNAVRQRLDDARKLMVQLGIQIGLDLASMVDPTGALSIPAAAYALRNGDYLGSALNLVGVIPLFGKAADAAKLAKIADRLTGLTKEVKFLERWLEISAATAKRLHQAGTIENPLRAEIQGTTKASSVAKAAAGVKGADEAAQALKNGGTLLKIRNAANLGFLDEEIAVMRRLAKDGYYFVIRSCPKVRAEWLKACREHGWGIIAKPVWLKIKSLKGVKYAGLVGFGKGDERFRKTIKDLKQVGMIPADLKLDWLAMRGMSASQVKVFRLERGMNVPKIEDSEMMLSHYFIDTGDAFVIVDRFGRPYLSDLDIVSIQRRIGSGRYAPPGMNVGPGKARDAIKTSDDAEYSAYWNKYFKTVRYPSGYQPFGWHGGVGGSAAYFGKAPKQFDASMGVRSLGWDPEKPEEDLVVAIEGVEDLHDSVGYCTGWDKLKMFQQSNTGLGEWRFNANPPAAAHH